MAASARSTAERLRKRPRLSASEPPSEGAALREGEPSLRAQTSATGEDGVLRAVLEELQQLREERRLEQQERQRAQAEVQRLQERLRGMSTTQLSPPNNVLSRSNFQNPSAGIRDLGYKLKPDVFDGTVPLREFFSQFLLISRANGWDETAKAVALASCLRGKARSILDSVDDLETLEFEELKSKLEFRFGEGNLTQNYYSQFVNRKQKFGEDFSTLGADLERLSRLAYPECSHEMRDKIACSQFITALSEGFIKRTIQLEGIFSLKIAIERAKAIKIINENSFSKKEGRFSHTKKNNVFPKTGNDDKIKEIKSGDEKKRKFSRINKGVATKGKECWHCGEMGHFRSECPRSVSEN